MNIVSIGIFWLLGIIIASRTQVGLPIWGVAVLLSLAGFTFFRRRDQRTAMMLVWLCALAAGAGHYMAAQPPPAASHVVNFNDQPRPVILEGLVVDEPDVRDRSQGVRLQAERITFDDGTTQTVEGLVQVTTLRYPELQYGMRLRLEGNLTTPEELEEFDYRAYLARQGVHSVMAFPTLIITQENAGARFYHLIYSFKARAENTINQMIPDPEASLLRAFILGNDAGMPASLLEDFRLVGLSHIITISGFHVAIIMAVLVPVMDPLFGKRNAVWVVSAILIVYTILVGAPVAMIRSVIMGIAYLIGSRILGRSGFTLAILVGAAIILSAVNPLVLWDISFQLTFAATLGLILFSQRFDRWGVRQLRRIMTPSGLVYAIIEIFVRVEMVSFSAQLLAVPIILYHFERFSTLSLLANPLVVPVSSITIILGALATLLGLILLPLGQVIAWPAWLFLKYMNVVVIWLADIPLPAVGSRLSLNGAILYYAVVGGLSWFFLQEMERRRQIVGRLRVNISERATFGVSLVAAVLVFVWADTQPDGLLHLTFLDVGQGDAIFIETPSGRQILIDGGNFPTLLNQYLGQKIPFWDRDLDIIIATHADQDHTNGLPGVFDRYRVGQLITNGSEAGDAESYGAVLNKASEHNVPVHTARAGEVIVVEDGVRLEIIHPGAEVYPERNENSVSVRLVYGSFTALLTGDAEEEGEQDMVASQLPLTALVFKAGHHGSRSSSNTFFLERVQPQIAVVSAGLNNRFGHPHPEVLERLAAAGAVVLNTMDLGSIEVITDGAQMWWQAAQR